MESSALETPAEEVFSLAWMEEPTPQFHAVWICEDAMYLPHSVDSPEDASQLLAAVHEEDEEGSLQNLLSEGNADEQQQLLCNLCDTWFARLADFRAHLKRHREPAPYKCALCERVFLGRTGLLLHGRRAHQNQQQLKCKQCGSQFSFIHTYEEHLRTHDESKEYKCPDCAKEFRRITEFRRHRRVHTGEKPHHCAHCGRAFSQQTNLRRHLRVHTGEKPFRCSVCGKHFRQSNVLRLHMRLHTGERPYQCPVCEQKFTQRPHRHRHLESHGVIFIGKDSASKEEQVQDMLKKSGKNDREPPVEEEPVKKTAPDGETSSNILQPIVLQPNAAELDPESKGSAPEVAPAAAAGDGKPPRNTCNVCGTKFNRLCRLKKHLETHAKDNPSVNVLMV